ncbi:hypothetical protein DTO280E4_268 [Paecilomyces variotii]|nr:hypothetical protein DTO212C5_4578 [Paecilomyces variotii]KAJ9365972.1 hypothetical protein DTO280E4_268 [Paecilomyces variotii]
MREHHHSYYHMITERRGHRHSLLISPSKNANILTPHYWNNTTFSLSRLQIVALKPIYLTSDLYRGCETRTTPHI